MVERPIEKMRKALAENPKLTDSQLTGICGVSWPTAKKLRAEVQGEPAPETRRAKKAEVEEPTTWSVEIGIPENRADDLFSSFTAEEKMCAIQSVIQARMDAMLNPEAA